MAREEPAFKIKNSTVPVFVIHINTLDMGLLKTELQQRSAQMPGFFTNTPVVLGLAGISGSDSVPDFADLVGYLIEHGMRVAGVQGGSEAQRLAAAVAGLGSFPEAAARDIKTRRKMAEDSQPEVAEVGEAEAGSRQVSPAIAIADVPAQAVLPGLDVPPVAEAAPACDLRPEETSPPAGRPTLVIDKPVRAGQRIHAEGASMVVMAIVNAGAELIADGDIHVYAPLRGRALAGARGNEGARIFIQSLEAELVSVSGYFQVFEDGIPDHLRGKPVQVYLQDGQLRLEPLRH